MSRSTTLSSLALPFAQGQELIQAFGAWWLREFLSLFPQRIADWLVDNGRRTLVLAPEADAIALYLKTDRRRLLASSRISRADFSPHLIDEFLRRNRLSRAQVPIGLGLPGELIFRRDFALPLETRRSLDAVVVQDLLAKTPFQLEDIHHAHRVSSVGDKLVVSQCVVRRAHVAAAADAWGLGLEDIGFIECHDAGHSDGVPRIDTKTSISVDRNRWVQRISVSLVATTLLLTITALGTRYHQQQGVLDGLQAEVAAATVKVKREQGMVDKLQQEQAVLLRHRAKREAPGLLDIWEEATRILPAHTWLLELRLSEASEGRLVVITGFSAAAASLVGLLDRSTAFAEAALVGPIAVDPTEGKERFIIQAKLKPPASSRTGSR